MVSITLWYSENAFVWKLSCNFLLKKKIWKCLMLEWCWLLFSKSISIQWTNWALSDKTANPARWLRCRDQKSEVLRLKVPHLICYKLIKIWPISIFYGERGGGSVWNLVLIEVRSHTRPVNNGSCWGEISLDAARMFFFYWNGTTFPDFSVERMFFATQLSLINQLAPLAMNKSDWPVLYDAVA